MNNLEQKEQELLMVENEYWVSQAEALERLHNNPDFKKVILDGYFIDKAVNGVSMLANDATIAKGERPAVIEDLVGVSSLQDHFITIRNLGTVDPEEQE